jgi:predicted MPP superfamily phosphohydrolase
MPIGRRGVLKALLAGGLGVVTGTSAYGCLYGRHELEVTQTTVPVIDLWVSHDDVALAVARLMNARPDLIILGGDYVTRGDRHYVTPAADALAPLSAPHGVFGILGNHDDDRDMPGALVSRGVQILKDARTRLVIRGEALELIGIRYWTRREADIGALVRRASGTIILVAHDPRRLAEASALNIPLMLSGHTHGGQVVLPLFGAIAAQKFPVLGGIGRRKRTTMFVSRGLGTVYVPARVNCPPEVAVLTLQPDSVSPRAAFTRV